MPDPSTFRILPWRPSENGVARMFCDIRTPDGQPFSGDPRFVLKQGLARAAEKGLTYHVGPNRNGPAYLNRLNRFFATANQHAL